MTAAGGYLIQGELQREQVEQLARELFADPIVERFVVGQLGRNAEPATSPRAIPRKALRAA